MPTVTLNRKVFDKLMGKKLSESKLRDRISFLGTDLEDVTEDEIIVEVFPNRPDMLSEQGFARAMASFIGTKTGLQQFKVIPSKEKVIIESSVKEVRPYTACAIVKNLSFNDEKIRELVQIQEKLHVTFGRNRKKAAIGIYPYEKIKPPIRFIGMKPEEIKFRPLESNKQMNGLQILSQHKAGRAYGHLLEGKKIFPVFLDANDQVLSVPPIINSHKTGKIGEKTTDVFIECSGFDFKTQNLCLNIIVTALADMGGQVYSMELIYGNKKFITPDLNPRKMLLKRDYVNKLLGLKLTESQMKALLRRMGLDYKNGSALIPAYRADIIHPSDLAEDIAIAYGYDNFTDEIPKVATISEEDPFFKFKEKIANLLVGLGLLEANTYHITNKDFQSKKMNTEISVVELKNALTVDYNVLRSWMIPVLMQILSENKHHEYPQKLFEIGTIFKKGISETGVVEHKRLAVVISSNDVDFTQIKQVLDYIFRLIDMKYDIRDIDCNSFIPGRVGRVSVSGKDVAYIGEIHPKVLSNWQLEMPVAALELNLTELFEIMKL